MEDDSSWQSLHGNFDVATEKKVKQKKKKRREEKKDTIASREPGRDRSDPFCRAPSRFPGGISRGEGMKGKVVTFRGWKTELRLLAITNRLLRSH